MYRNHSLGIAVILLFLCIFLCSCGTNQGDTTHIPSSPDINSNEKVVADYDEVSPSPSPTEDTISVSPAGEILENTAEDASDGHDDVPESLNDISILSVMGELDASTYINMVIQLTPLASPFYCTGNMA